MGLGDSYLPEPIKTKEMKEGDFSNGYYASCTMQGWRKTMEDTVLTVPDLNNNEVSVFGVFDGHGGPEVAEFVRRHFCAQLVKASGYRPGNYKKALSETYMKMDSLLSSDIGRKELRQMRGTSVKKPERGQTADTDSKIAHNVGCTATVVLVNKRILYVANAGDSRAILITKEGAGIDLTKDHKPNLKGENERIKKAGGSIVNGRIDGDLNISRTIGDLFYKSNKLLKKDEQMIISVPEITIQPIIPEIAYVFIASDGIFGVKSTQEVADFITKDRKKRQNVSLSETLENLVEDTITPDCIKSGGIGADNMSCILLKIC